MSRRHSGSIRILVCHALVLLGASAPARAQIYSWRDGQGHLVLSDRKASEGATVHSYPVPGTETVKTTRRSPAGRTQAFDALITEHATLNGVREDLVRAVVHVESGFNPYARSPKGALGLMQLMPATVRQFGVANPFDPSQNIAAGVKYLRQLLDRYDNNEQLALAAYNAGAGAVDRHGQRVPPYAETVRYVERITGMTGESAEHSTTRIYSVVEVIDGREVVRYTDRKPAR